MTRSLAAVPSIGEIEDLLREQRARARGQAREVLVRWRGLLASASAAADAEPSAPRRSGPEATSHGASAVLAAVAALLRRGDLARALRALRAAEDPEPVGWGGGLAIADERAPGVPASALRARPVSARDPGAAADG